MARSATKVAGGGRGRAGARYLDLVSAFPLRPLRTEEERDAAQEVLEGLLVAGPAGRLPEEQDYFRTSSSG